MGIQSDTQSAFFQMIRERIDQHLSLVDEVAELLEVSNDSAYRRIRGETALSLAEAATLCVRFNCSLDSLIRSSSDEVIFDFQPLNEETFDFAAYLEYIRDTMKLIASSPEKEVVYMANDIPLFHLMHSPAVASFKLFFWQKTILDFSEFRSQKFKLNVKDDRINEISREIRQYYCAIPSTEIYSSEAIDTTLKQIEYYYVSGLFEDRQEALMLCDQLEELIEHVRLQCEAGYKFKVQDDKGIPEHVPYPKEGNYSVYHNEVIYTDNTILVRLGDQFLSFLTSNGINSLSTRNESFYRNSYKSLDILKKRSTLISGTSEKERNRVFLRFLDKISETRARLR